MLDVLCTNTAGTDLDVNIACPTCGVPQSVGYRIGGNMFLWHGGDVTSVYTGVQAGNGIPSAVAHNNTFTGYQTGTSPLINQNNTFTGYQAGQNNINSNNTFTGYQTGRVNSGADNTFTGYAAGTNNTFGVENTFTGDNAGISNTTGNNNTFTGYDAGYSNNADYNTFTGWKCGFNNTVGHHNEFYGKRAGYNNLDGYNDCYYGSHCAFWTLHADSNVFMGTNTGLQQQGGDNVMIGWDAGTFNGTSTTVFNPYYSYYNVFIGSYVARNSNASWNTIIGAYADALVPGVRNACAIADTARVMNSNNFILGNNTQFVGIGLSGVYQGPQANLEIRTDKNPIAPVGPYPTATGFLGSENFAFPNAYGGTGFSGLKFTNLTSASTPCTGNPGTGVLSVDIYGNVIYVPVGNGTGIGAGYCTPGPLPALTGDAGYNLNNVANFYFAGNGSGSLANNNVGIGLNCVTPDAKLEVLQSSTANASIGIHVNNTDNAIACPSSPQKPSIGIKSEVTSTAPGPNIAGLFDAQPVFVPCCNIPGNFSIFVPPNGGTVSIGYPFNSTAFCNDMAANLSILAGSLTTSPPYAAHIIGHYVGVLAEGIGNATYTSPVGLQGNAMGGTVANYGVKGISDGISGTAINYGVYGEAANGATNYAGYFNGDVYVNGGSNSGTGYLYTSDKMFKTDIDSLTNSLSIIKQLKPSSFYFDTANVYKIRFSSKKQYGFIAQDIQAVLPELVYTSTKPAEYDSIGNLLVPSVTYKSLNYSEFIALLTRGMQQQQDTIRSQGQTIDSLRTAFKSIQTCINKLCDTNHHSAIKRGSDDGSGNCNNTINVTLSSSATLYQNAPNPFGEGGTKINYFIPENTVGATIVFYDMYGNRLKEVQLTQTGMGTININPDKLSNGAYTYSLVIGGNVVDTKKMVFAK